MRWMFLFQSVMVISKTSQGSSIAQYKVLKSAQVVLRLREYAKRGKTNSSRDLI